MNHFNSVVVRMFCWILVPYLWSMIGCSIVNNSHSIPFDLLIGHNTSPFSSPSLLPKNPRQNLLTLINPVRGKKEYDEVWNDDYHRSVHWTALLKAHLDPHLHFNVISREEALVAFLFLPAMIASHRKEKKTQGKEYVLECVAFWCHLTWPPVACPQTWVIGQA